MKPQIALIILGLYDSEVKFQAIFWFHVHYSVKIPRKIFMLHVLAKWLVLSHPIKWWILIAGDCFSPEQHALNRISVKSRVKFQAIFWFRVQYCVRILQKIFMNDRKIISCLHPIEWGIFLLWMMMVAPESSSEQHCELNRISVETRGQRQVSSDFLISCSI